jgi:hypothetical protein
MDRLSCERVCWCAAVLVAHVQAMAWSPPLERSSSLWDATMLWALRCGSSEDGGISPQGGQDAPDLASHLAGRMRKGELHALSLAPTGRRWDAAGARKGLDAQWKTPALLLDEEGLAHLPPPMLEVVAVNQNTTPPQPEGSAQVSQEGEEGEEGEEREEGEEGLDIHMVLVAWGAQLQVWRATVAIDEDGVQQVRQVAPLSASHLLDTLASPCPTMLHSIVEAPCFSLLCVPVSAIL